MFERIHLKWKKDLEFELNIFCQLARQADGYMVANMPADNKYILSKLKDKFDLIYSMVDWENN